MSVDETSRYRELRKEALRQLGLTGTAMSASMSDDAIGVALADKMRSRVMQSASAAPSAVNRIAPRSLVPLPLVDQLNLAVSIFGYVAKELCHTPGTVYEPSLVSVHHLCRQLRRYRCPEEECEEDRVAHLLRANATTYFSLMRSNFWCFPKPVYEIGLLVEFVAMLTRFNQYLDDGDKLSRILNDWHSSKVSTLRDHLKKRDVLQLLSSRSRQLVDLLADTPAERTPIVHFDAALELATMCLAGSVFANASASLISRSRQWIEVLLSDLHGLASPDSRIGGGGEADVHRATWVSRSCQVAVKRCSRTDAVSRERFRREINFLHELPYSPHIIQLLGIAEDADRGGHMILLELMDSNLFEWLKAHVATALVGQQISLSWQAASGLRDLHGLRPPVLARDVKSLNFLVRTSPHGEITLKLADFGGSVVHDETALQTQLTAKMRQAGGTPRWTAPELLGASPEMAREPSDVYSLGVVLWEIWTRRLPWKEKDAAAIARAVKQGKSLADDFSAAGSAVPNAVQSLIRACLSLNPDHRPTAAEVVAVLAGWKDSDPATWSYAAPRSAQVEPAEADSSSSSATGSSSSSAAVAPELLLVRALYQEPMTQSEVVKELTLRELNPPTVHHVGPDHPGGKRSVVLRFAEPEDVDRVIRNFAAESQHSSQQLNYAIAERVQPVEAAILMHLALPAGSFSSLHALLTELMWSDEDDEVTDDTGTKLRMRKLIDEAIRKTVANVPGAMAILRAVGFELQERPSESALAVQWLVFPSATKKKNAKLALEKLDELGLKEK